MSSTLLAAGQTITLQRAIEPGGIVAFYSATCNTEPSNGVSAINLVDNSGNILLHISLRPQEDVIVFNSQAKGGNWGSEERQNLRETLILPSFNIKICDHGDQYQILFSYQTIHYYKKRINGIVSSVAYNVQQDPSIFADVLVVASYDSLEDLVLANEHATSEARPIPLLEREEFEAAASTRATFSHGLGPTPIPEKKKKDRLGFEYAEHAFLGDAITLKLSSGGTALASDYPFKLPSGLNLTYGTINGLAGDFYGTYDPISDGGTEKQRVERFLAAFNTLAVGVDRQPQEALAILKVLQKEVDAVNTALQHHEDPSVAYSKLPDESWEFIKITFGRKGLPGYLGLAAINWDHFGEHARIAYNTGHGVALSVAAEGDLDKAYTINAFADHFLEDSFSAGHLRTPRRELHWDKPIINNLPIPDLCAKFMHDEDCAIGLSVQNPSGEQWTAYGDKKALDQVNEDNKERCIAAVQASADEIFVAWKTHTIPAAGDYKAWTHAPTLASAGGQQVLAPLFKPGQLRRSDVKNRRLWQFTKDWWYATTAALCKYSGWWKYPITIDGPTQVLTRTAMAATASSPWNCRVYYQNAAGVIQESFHLDGVWTHSTLFSAKPFTPLAAISWEGGREVRVYCLSVDDLLQEWCWSGSGWYQGLLSDLRVRPAPNTSIAAVVYENPGLEITVFCQESGSDAIREIRSGHPWYRASILPVACTGSSLAATTYIQNGVQIRVYFQAPDLTFQEHCWGAGKWFKGEFRSERVPRHSAITASVRKDTTEKLRLFFQDSRRTFVGYESNGGWKSTGSVLEPTPSSTPAAAIQWNSGRHVRFYYQSRSDEILEHCNDGSGWFAGATLVERRSA
ncbi:hypothetical protein ANO14919_047040 [Xylariales sp. No.14919]|nr:fungal fucose-specific lectin-domain-containing protein [Xylaria grammica]GAW15295.1 hypothetical protein ANO14919_047040 [Xylariales sp. No.14919]